MNILFICDTDISPLAGGLERVVFTLSQEFSVRNNNCFLAFYDSIKLQPQNSFKDKIQLNRINFIDNLRNFSTKNKIDIIITGLAQKRNFVPLMQPLYEFTRPLNIKVVYGYYNMPGYELNGGIDFKLALYRIFHKQSIKQNATGALVKILQKCHLNSLLKKKIARKLQTTTFCDTIFVLSEFYIPEYKKYINKDSNVPFIAIGNPLSYAQNINVDEIGKKEKLVINVSRFDDSHKRQSIALKIWKRIEENSKYDDWKLLLIGYGCDEQYIKSFVKSLNLKRVEIQPAQNAVEKYKRASIYMKTSAYEGLPMILLDVQQFGVVPMSFDSFAAVRDVIENNKNGFIISNGNQKEYAEKLMWLMDHDSERDQMAINGLSSCLKFKTSNIVDKWLAFLENLTNKKL